jgi:hypothetical protein
VAEKHQRGADQAGGYEPLKETRGHGWLASEQVSCLGSKLPTKKVGILNSGSAWWTNRQGCTLNTGKALQLLNDAAAGADDEIEEDIESDCCQREGMSKIPEKMAASAFQQQVAVT